MLPSRHSPSLLLLVLVVLAPTRGLLLLLHSQPARRWSGGVVRSNAAPRLLPVRGSGRHSHDFLSDVENGDGGAVGADRPCVTLKIALDANGAVDELADQESKRFTCGASLDLVHRLRAASDAVAVGVGTVLRDDPSLTVRRNVALPPSAEGRQPLRVIFDNRLRTPGTATVLADDHATQLFCSEGYALFRTGGRGVDDDLSITTSSSSSSSSSSEGSKDDDDDDSSADGASAAEAGDEAPVVVLKHIHGLAKGSAGPNDSSGGGGALRDALAFLRRERGVEHLMLEGGPGLVRSFLAAQCVDRAVVITAPGVTFREPVSSGGLDADEPFATAGLEPLHDAPGYALDADTVRCWARPGIPWPSSGGGTRAPAAFVDEEALRNWP